MSCFFQQVYSKVIQAGDKNGTPEIKMKDMIKDAVLVLIDKARCDAGLFRPPLCKRSALLPARAWMRAAQPNARDPSVALARARAPTRFTVAVSLESPCRC